ncbi:hypothetical protein ACSS6W_002928 [Trichoderma asperelloides]
MSAPSQSKPRNNCESTMETNRLSTGPTGSSGIPRRTIATQCTASVRSATPSSSHLMSLLPSPKGLPADPPGDRSNLRGLVRRPGPAPSQHLAAVSGTIAPGFRKKGKDKKTKKEMLQKVANSSPQSADILDGVPMELARAVVNMQQYYASGVDELAEKLGDVEEELRRAKEENLRMKKRLDMHFGMLGQAAEFMQRVSEGLGMAMPVDEKMLGRREGDEELKQGFDDDENDDGDLPMEGVNMEVPPMPVDDRPPMRSTGRMASNRRRMMQEKSPAQRRRGKEKRRMVAAEVLPIREKVVIPQDDGDDDDDNIDRMKESNSEIRLEEESRHRCEGNGSDDAKILEGAPRLQAIIRQDAIRRSAIRQDITRQSRFTPINRVPSRQSTPSVDNDAADSDEYCPSSPSSASSSSSSHSLPEEETIPSSTIAIPKLTPSPNPQLQTPLPASASSTSTSTSSHPSKPRYSVTRRTTIPRYASGPPGKPFRFHRMGRTVLDVWTEYKRGSKGNPAIEALERQYGTDWRTGEDTRELKYASNYVSVRQKVVSQVEEMCEREGISAMEACRRLDERVDGRMQLLISAVRKGQDPFVVIPKR